MPYLSAVVGYRVDLRGLPPALREPARERVREIDEAQDPTMDWLCSAIRSLWTEFPGLEASFAMEGEEGERLVYRSGLGNPESATTEDTSLIGARLIIPDEGSPSQAAAATLVRGPMKARLKVAEKLSRRRNADDIPELLAALDHDATRTPQSLELRQTIYRALGWHDTPVVHDTLLRVVGTEPPGVIESIAAGMWRLDAIGTRLADAMVAHWQAGPHYDVVDRLAQWLSGLHEGPIDPNQAWIREAPGLGAYLSSFTVKGTRWLDATMEDLGQAPFAPLAARELERVRDPDKREALQRHGPALWERYKGDDPHAIAAEILHLLGEPVDLVASTSGAEPAPLSRTSLPEERLRWRCKGDHIEPTSAGNWLVSTSTWLLIVDQEFQTVARLDDVKAGILVGTTVFATSFDGSQIVLADAKGLDKRDTIASVRGLRAVFRHGDGVLALDDGDYLRRIGPQGERWKLKISPKLDLTQRFALKCSNEDPSGVYVSDSTGLRCFDDATGKPRWCNPGIERATETKAAVAERESVVYYLADRRIYQLDLHTGRTLSCYSMPAETAWAGLTLHPADHDGVRIDHGCIKLGESVRSSTYWNGATVRHDSRSRVAHRVSRDVAGVKVDFCTTGLCVGGTLFETPQPIRTVGPVVADCVVLKVADAHGPSTLLAIGPLD